MTVFITIVMAACSAKMQTYDLSEEYATSLHYQPAESGAPVPETDAEKNKGALVGVPARNFYGGDLKRGGIWWAGKGIILTKGDTFALEATNVGPDNTPFGATFPPINLIKEPVMVKISARAEGAAGDEPVLYFQPSDVDGAQANAKRPFQKIENSPEFKDYYFDLRDIYNQAEPEKRKVNGAMINSVKFFINPGQSTGYTGVIYIKEIKVVPVEAGK
ncbi:MAG TPA: hypothetical protein VK766_01605 [Cytophagaceae bacterium]|nr:hypothetical protein [Cytophagaceae bacterium]